MVDNNDLAASTPRVLRRLVFVDHTARLSGAELALREMAGWELAEQVMVLLHEDGPLVAELDKRGMTVRIEPLPEALRLSRATTPSPGNLLRAVGAAIRHMFHMWQVLRRERADVVYLNTLSAFVLTSLPALLTRSRIVWHVRDAIAPPHTGRTTARLTRLWAKAVCAGVIANSRYTLAQLGRFPDRTRLLVLPSPVPAPVPRPARAGSATGLTIAMVGRLTSWKGQHVFLDAFARAFGEVPLHRAVLAGAPLFEGDADYEQSLRQQVERLGISDRVEFLGHVHDVPDLLSQADILVHSSVFPEPFGQVVLQGLLAGTAVIATDAGGPAEIVTSGTNGLLVPPGDPVALADALGRLADDRHLLNALASQSELIRVSHNSESIRKTLQEFLAGL